MGVSAIPFFVGGVTAGAHPQWAAHRGASPGFDFHLAHDPSTLGEWLEAVAAAGAPYAMVSLDPAMVLPQGWRGMARDAVRHADRLVDRWLLLTAGGLTPNLEAVDYGFYNSAQSLTCSGDLTPCLVPFPQLQLWNLRASADHERVPFPPPAGARADLWAAWAALPSGLACFVSPHLRFGRAGLPAPAPPPSDGWRTRLTTVVGAQPDEARQALQALGGNDADSRQALADEQRHSSLLRAVASIGLAAGAARAVRESRPDVRISVVVRTILTRPAMLARTLASLAVASRAAPLHEVLLTSEHAQLAEAVVSLRRRFPGLALRPVPGPHPDVPSRTANLIAGAQAATGDYVWFLDDDDVADPDAPATIQAAVHSRYHPILIGDCDVYEEEVAPAGKPEAVLDRSRPVRTYRAAGWVTAFSGMNPVPICAVLYPRPILQRIATTSLLRHDLNQDYAVLLLALNDPAAEVRVLRGRLADISLRAGPASDNATFTCGPAERSASISGFMADILAPGSGYRVVPTQLGKEVARLTRENRRLEARLRRLQPKPVGDAGLGRRAGEGTDGLSPQERQPGRQP